MVTGLALALADKPASATPLQQGHLQIDLAQTARGLTSPARLYPSCPSWFLLSAWFRLKPRWDIHAVIQPQNIVPNSDRIQKSTASAATRPYPRAEVMTMVSEVSVVNRKSLARVLTQFPQLTATS